MIFALPRAATNGFRELAERTAAHFKVGDAKVALDRVK